MSSILVPSSNFHWCDLKEFHSNPFLYLTDFNLVAIVILSRGKCGLSKCITRYLVAMAAADFAVIITDVIMHRINNMYFPVSFLFLTPVCSLRHVMYIVSLDCSVWFTVAFTFDRFIAICCHKLKPKYCTQRTATVVISVVCVVSFLRSIPGFIVYKPLFVISNVSWYCVGKSDYWTSTFWRAYECIDSILTPVLPILFILLFNALTVKNIIAANRARKGLRSKSENQNDTEMENWRKSIFLLFALSANFVLLWMTYLVHSLRWQLENFNYQNKYLNNPVYITQQFGFMLQVLSSSTNTCIYGLTQKKFREELKKGIKYLFTLNGKLVHTCTI
ncbi:probable G-protein coupled receptor 139 [Heterodontus francisci]|uniref:probable G-protein coupled receptor 139 n=1 Tax=Heterodontus francisci TaxID=7792 RepID=UPI00355AEA70